MRHSVLNAEAFTAVFFLLILLLRSRRRTCTAAAELAAPDSILCAVIAIIILAAFWRVLWIPLLHDSYGHVYTAGHEKLSDVLRQFAAHPEHGDFFFRPLGYLSFWIDWQWAGDSPFRWHAWSVFVHLLNTLLLYALARRVELCKFGAFTAALLFGLHGSRPEAVAWVAARFDLLAALFSILALHCAVHYAESEKRAWLAVLGFFTGAAVLSKESAYCLPLLVAGVLLLRWRPRRVLIPSAVVLSVSAVLFLYRMWILRGIGGYGAESGAPAVLRFSLVKTLNALFFREWALLFFPLNWSHPPGFVLWLGIAAFILALATARADRRALAITLGIVLCAALPVQHLLLIGSDLSGSRVLYLPVLGLALFWGIVVQSVQLAWVRHTVCALLLAFQMAALEHNLAIWIHVARTSQRVCTFLVGEIEQHGSPIVVSDAPATLQGVYFLKNSLPACVFLNAGGTLTALPDITSGEASGKAVFHWNADTEALELRR